MVFRNLANGSILYYTSRTALSAVSVFMGRTFKWFSDPAVTEEVVDIDRFDVFASDVAKVLRHCMHHASRAPIQLTASPTTSTALLALVKLHPLRFRA
jgi:hypothetical protein